VAGIVLGYMAFSFGNLRMHKFQRVVVHNFVKFVGVVTGYENC
jgi:hypothetical protein